MIAIDAARCQQCGGTGTIGVYGHTDPETGEHLGDAPAHSTRTTRMTFAPSKH